MISVSKSFHILNGLPLVEFTKGRYFIKINLLRTRMLNLEGGVHRRSGVQDHSDVYWRRESDPNFIRLLEAYQENPELRNPASITLYEFACDFTRTWRLYHMNKIPHITPNFFRPPKKTATPERYLLFLRTRLLEHKPGTTHEEIFNMEVELLESEMMSLMQTDACPNLVEEEFSETQTETPEPEEEPELPVQPEHNVSTPQYEDDVNSQGSDCV